MRTLTTAPLASLALIAMLSACGGGGGAADPSPAQNVVAPQATQTPADSQAAELAPAPVAETPVVDAAAAPGSDVELADAQATQDGPLFAPDAQVAQTTLTDLQRATAASKTASNAANACGAIRPFYWEVGNKNGRLVSGSIYAAGNANGFTALTPLSVASSSKWLYAAYVAQKQAGVLSSSDRRFLSLQSGYISMNATNCYGTKTVNGCLAAASNGAYTKGADGRFDYNGGHMQKHASLLGLGAMDNVALTKEMRAQIGTDVDLSFITPVIAGGVVMTSDAYARFLRKLLGGQLRLASMLGSTPVCTNHSTCSSALLSPVPSSESWHYSVGHWVEDDPKVGDGAFSSAGAYGFYPWIDAGKTSYGVIGRLAAEGSGYASAQCGRLIRKAYATGAAL